MKKIVLSILLFSFQLHACTPKPSVLDVTIQQAEQGNLDAQITLGNAYLFGELEQEVNYKKSAYWLKQAADHGDAASQYNLAIQYFRGLGIPKNLEYAFHYYKRAAEQGHAKAQIQLALRYLYGEGTSVNSDQAEYWYTQAESHPDPDSLQFLNEFRKKYPNFKHKTMD